MAKSGKRGHKLAFPVGLIVVLLATIWYVVPFVWSVFVTLCKVKVYKVKATKVEEELDK